LVTLNDKIGVSQSEELNKTNFQQPFFVLRESDFIMTKQNDENGLAKSFKDIIFGKTESENWCKTVEIKKEKARRLSNKAASLTEELSEITKKAAQDRWRKKLSGSLLLVHFL